MRSLLIGLVLVMTTGTGWAKDIVGTWKTEGDRPLTTSFRDENRVRLETGPDSYILVKGDKVYMVSRTEGKWQAIDMDEMSGMMKMFGKGADVKAITGSEPTFEFLGRQETIAGYQGKVYRVSYTDASGLKQEEEMVLSDHPDITKINQAWVSLASRMAQMMGKDTAEALEKATKTARDKGYGGMLRSGNDMILESLQKVSREDSYYELPEGVELVHMGAMGGGAPYPAGTEPYHETLGQTGDSVKGEAKDLASETAQEVKDEAKQEAKDSAKKNIKKALGGLW